MHVRYIWSSQHMLLCIGVVALKLSPAFHAFVQKNLVGSHSCLRYLTFVITLVNTFVFAAIAVISYCNHAGAGARLISHVAVCFAGGELTMSM